MKAKKLTRARTQMYAARARANQAEQQKYAYRDELTKKDAEIRRLTQQLNAANALPLPKVTWENERAIFEKWVSDQGVSRDYRGDGIYGNPTVKRWREGYLAAIEIIQFSPYALRKENEKLKAEVESFRRMLIDACSDLGLINEALGLDPDDGGAEPILEAIAKLKGGAA